MPASPPSAPLAVPMNGLPGMQLCLRQPGRVAWRACREGPAVRQAPLPQVRVLDVLEHCAHFLGHLEPGGRPLEDGVQYTLL